MALADWIMRIATENPPKGRETWAQAMRAEYASLSDSKLGWALGCWSTMLGWRLRADTLYFAALIAAVVLIYFTGFSGRLQYVIWLSPLQSMISHFDIHPLLVFMLIAAIALNAVNPRRPVLTGLTLVAMQQLHWVVNEWYVRWKFAPYIHPTPSGPLHIFSAPPIVGILAQIGVCCVGAIVGAWIARKLRKPPSTADAAGAAFG